MQTPAGVGARVAGADEFHYCAAIRRAVFVEEQGVPLELEMDDLDKAPGTVHFLLIDNVLPVGTARLFPAAAAAHETAGKRDPTLDGCARIGRVAILNKERGRGYGRVLMEFVLAEASRRGYEEAILDSQVDVIPFYELLGFIAEGDVFEEAGIPHRRMRRHLFAAPPEAPGPPAAKALGPNSSATMPSPTGSPVGAVSGRPKWKRRGPVSRFMETVAENVVKDTYRSLGGFWGGVVAQTLTGLGVIRWTKIRVNEIVRREAPGKPGKARRGRETVVVTRERGADTARDGRRKR